jgi:hypothetical protein
MPHAPLPPSAAERWIACPSSRQAETEAPPTVLSAFADLGTHAHELFARGLRLGLAIEALTTDPAIRQPLALALAAMREILGPRTFMVEIRLPALAGLPALWGTADVVGFSLPGPADTIADLKFGKAILVEADTPQLGVYAVLAARCYGVAEGGITAWTIQPRYDHADGLARRHHYSRDALDQLEVRLREAAAATLVPNAPRRAGPWCRWCRAAATCPVRQAMPDAVPPTVSGWFRPTPRWLTAARA